MLIHLKCGLGGLSLDHMKGSGITQTVGRRGGLHPLVTKRVKSVFKYKRKK